MGFWKTFKEGVGVSAGLMAGAIVGSALWGMALAVVESLKKSLGIDDGKSSEEKEDESTTEEEES